MTAIEYAYVLRTADAEGHSYGGFTWPEKGKVSCPDWKPTAECGNGLHGLLHGEGDGSLLNWAPDARWIVVKVKATEVVDLVGKVKFPSGTVVYCGDRPGAAKYLDDHGCADRKVVGATRSAGYRGTATAGDGGTATAGDGGTATAGDRGTATAGDRGTATAGYRGTATAGYRGTATAGDGGTATAGYRGTATAGPDGALVIHWYDARKGRYRVSAAEVGENGIKANTKYRLDADGRFVPVSAS
jgi:hypothetical protein